MTNLNKYRAKILIGFCYRPAFFKFLINYTIAQVFYTYFCAQISIMPSVSHRSQTVPLSPFRKLIPIADAAKENGVHVYHLNIGQPDIKTPAAAITKFRSIDWDILPYSPSNGWMSYRKALAHYFNRFGVSLSAEEVMVTTGGSEAILFFMLACLDPGDEIIIPEPFYANYNGFAHIADVRVVPITSYIEDGFSLPSSAAFANKITPRTRAPVAL